MNGVQRAGLLVAAMAFVIDQLTKLIIIYPLSLREKAQIEIWPIFDLTWMENRGISLGLFQADGEWGRWLLVALTGVVAAGVAFWLWREKQRWDGVALGLILGGALGNILDRMRHGYVVDFLDLHFGNFRPFQIFNVADAAITLGVLLLLARTLFVREKGVEPIDHDAAGKQASDGGITE